MDVYYDLVEKVALRKSVREEFVGKIVQQVKKHMEDANIKAQVDGRVKHFFSIYKKMVNQDKTIDQIYDLFAVRILVDTVKDCYAALGVIHEMYKPIPGRFKDYIAMPKPNMYQSLHTTLIGPNGQPFDCFLLSNILLTMAIASSPLTRTIPMPELVMPVAMAAIVSEFPAFIFLSSIVTVNNQKGRPVVVKPLPDTPVSSHILKEFNFLFPELLQLQQPDFP